VVDLVVDLRLERIGSDWIERLDERENWVSLEWFSWVMTMHRTLLVFEMLTHDVFISVYL
jgi:hypothetical protein